jgi:hypothetical protein
MVLERPTATNTPEPGVVVVVAVAVLLSSDFAQEETSTAMLTITTNQDNKLFILFLFGKCCKIKTTNLYVTSISLYYKEVGRLWRVSDCEELVGVTHKR